MAVVDKKPETSTAQPLKLGLASLAGVVYTVGGLAVAFKAVPAAFALIGIGADNILPGLIGIVLLVGLAIVGYRMMGGAHSRPGLRAGIFLGLVFLFFWLVISRWIGGFIENRIFNNSWFEHNETMVGGAVTAILSGLLGFWLLRVFLRPTMEKRFQRFEESGWFSATTFKPGQGTRVRRGTILGILLMTGGGIWVMMNRGTLDRGSADWEMNIPFTGIQAVDDLGDAEPLIRDLKSSNDSVRILNPGDAKGELAENVTVSRKAALSVILPLAKTKQQKLESLLAELRKHETSLKEKRDSLGNPAEKEPVEAEMARVQTWIERLDEFEKELKAEDERLFLVQREIDRFVTTERDREQERKKESKRKALEQDFADISAWADTPKLPVAAQEFSLFDFRDINAKLDPLYFRVVKKEEFFAKLPKQYQFKDGERRDRTEFDAALEALKPVAPRNPTQTEKDEWAKEVRRVESDAKKAAPEAKPMRGTAYYSHLTLLPSVKYTLPLLLLIGSVWLAWRVVNVPAFADFLIATESELNKVSWTTRQRLYQDTIVVLVTMILMAVFLFVVDVGWGTLLSWKPIGVLRKAENKGDEKKEKDLKW